MSRIARTDFARLAAQLVVLTFAGGALFFSFEHITALALRFGATSTEAHAAPFYIDGFMLLGRMAMAKRFTERTNAIGRRFLIGGAMVSLAANVGAGETAGSRAFGALILIGFLLCEWLAGQFVSRAAVEAAEAAAALAAKRSAAGVRAAQTTRDRRAAAAAAPKARRRSTTKVATA